jgi:hypothetical protein
MTARVTRQSVDLSAYPDLVIIYLGMRVSAFGGMKTLIGLGPQIDKAGGGRPDGLLHFENNIIYSLFPLHVGMRWYWKDFASMEHWARSEPHRIWWQTFLRTSGGTEFWHEVYSMRGGVEAIYDDVKKPIGLGAFAPARDPRGAMFSARNRMGSQPGETPPPPDGVAEENLY